MRNKKVILYVCGVTGQSYPKAPLTLPLGAKDSTNTGRPSPHPAPLLKQETRQKERKFGCGHFCSEENGKVLNWSEAESITAVVYSLQCIFYTIKWITLYRPI